MEPEENTQRQGDPLNNNPGEKSVEIELIRCGIHLLNLKVVRYPKAEVAHDQEGHDLPARFDVVVLFSHILLLQICYEEQL